MSETIDVNFDFTTNTPGFWDNYWDNPMGRSACDPDSDSPMLKKYHMLLWSKQLPNHEDMKLEDGKSRDYLIWKNFRFGSDSITASFRYKRYFDIIKQVMAQLDDYKNFFETYTRKSYTIGGEIIFPKKKGSINQRRGCNHFIKDRFDLTLECIRKYYNHERSPLYDTLLENKEFFDLFVDFKGYVDFFFLQDLVTEDYSQVKLWLSNGIFDDNPLPKDENEYLQWISNELDFVSKRNKRIREAVEKSGILS